MNVLTAPMGLPQILHPFSHYAIWRSFTVLTFILLLMTSTAQDSNIKSTKRGVAYLGDYHRSDNALLLSSNSPLSWYYNWSPYPASRQIPLNGPMEFTPLIHGTNDAANSDTISAINSLPRSSTHLLTFNEPDGSVSSGGSNISPDDAARSYIDNLAPLRNSKDNNGRAWQISHPSVTGSSPGLDWLRRFNDSCYAIDAINGCPTDFIAAHWYGNFVGLASWLGQLDEFYNGNNTSRQLKIWVTELGLPQASPEATVQMMNQTLPYLDNLTYVERYAWFGAFRTDGGANEWTGDGVALFDQDGGLTQLGSLYMGGPGNGFEVGDKGDQSAAWSWRRTQRVGGSALMLWSWVMTVGSALI